MKQNRLVRISFSAVLAAAILLGGCHMDTDVSSTESEISLTESEVSASESLPDESSDPTSQPVEKTGPSIVLDKEIYEPGETITVTVTETDSKDWVGFYGEGAEPGSVNSIVWKYADSAKTLTFEVSSLGGAGDFGVFLCDNDGYFVLDRVNIKVLSDDRTDYGVAQAVYKSSRVNGIGKANITVTPSSEKELTYRLYWSGNGRRLADYEPLATVSARGTDPFVVNLNDCLFMPAEADGVEVAVKEGFSTSFFTAADNTLKRGDSKLLYRFAVISDLHIIENRPNHTTHLKSALNDIQTLLPDARAIFSVGDNTDHGTEKDYLLMMQTIAASGNLPPIYYALGNHDLMYGSNYNAQVELFKKHTGMSGAYYSLEIEGSTFIVLGSDSLVGEGTIGKTQLDWLRSELKNADSARPIYIFLHQPLIDTVSGSLYSSDPEVQYWYGIDSGDIVREIIKDYPQVVLFSGHTHWRLESRQPILYGGGTDASFVNTASVGYLWDDTNDSAPGSQGYFIEVYEDYILLKGREFVNGNWCAAAQFLFPLA